MDTPMQWEILAVLLGIGLMLLAIWRWARPRLVQDTVVRMVGTKRHAFPVGLFFAGALIWALGGGWPSTWEFHPRGWEVLEHPKQYENYIRHHIRGIDSCTLIAWQARGWDPETRQVTTGIGRRAERELARRGNK